MQQSTEQKRDQGSGRFGELVVGYAASVDVPQEEGVDGLVPLPSEFIPRRRVPPIFVELPVGEPNDEGMIEPGRSSKKAQNLRLVIPGNLREPIADAFEYDVEE